MLRIALLTSLTLAAPAIGQEIIMGNGIVREMPGSSVKMVETSTLANVGDSKAIKPAWELLKADANTPDPSAKDRQLKDAARTLGLFGYAEAADSMIPLLNNQLVGPTVRDEMLIALSKMNDKKLIPILKKELSSYRSLTARSHAAKALVEFGEPEGRPFLLTELQGHLDELEEPRQFRTGVREVLKTMADQELADGVAGMAERQKTDKAKENATSLANAMRINLKPMVEIIAIAQDQAFAKKDDRYAAISAIADRGTPAEIAVLLQMKPWESVETDQAAQRHDLRVRLSAAVVKIQQRNWQQLADANTPLVTNAQRRLEELHGDPPYVAPNRGGGFRGRTVIR